MSTELFVRRPLFWLTLAARKRADDPVLAKFWLPALSQGARRPADSGNGSFTGSFNFQRSGADFCGTLRRVSRQACACQAIAQFDVSGLRVGGGLFGRELPPAGRPYRWTSFNRHRLGVGKRVETVTARDRNAVNFMAVGRAIPFCQSESPTTRIARSRMATWDIFKSGART